MLSALHTDHINRARHETTSGILAAQMANTDKRKQSLYFPEEMLKEIQHEAHRLDRSLSWIVQHGWKVARDQIKTFPTSTDEPGAPDPLEE